MGFSSQAGQVLFATQASAGVFPAGFASAHTAMKLRGGSLGPNRDLLITDPEILLLDEPFGALDEFTREHMNMQMLDLTNRLGRTAILVTHSIQEAVFLADRIAVMSARPGRISGIVPVHLPKDRTPDITTTPEFQHYVEESRRMLHLGFSMEAK